MRTMLPPENPDEIFARKVPRRASGTQSQCSSAAWRDDLRNGDAVGCMRVPAWPACLTPFSACVCGQVARLRAQEAKEKAEAEAGEKGLSTGDSFLWKESVDKVREAQRHARQLAAFLDLLARSKLDYRPLDVSPLASSSNTHSAVIWHEARLQALERACASVEAAKDRLVHERTVDSKFVDSLQALCDNWNVRPIVKEGRYSAGPIGSLGVSLSCNMVEAPHELEFLLVLRGPDGSLQLKRYDKRALKPPNYPFKGAPLTHARAAALANSSSSASRALSTRALMRARTAPPASSWHRG